VPVRYIPHPIRAILNDITVGLAWWPVIYQNVRLRPVLILVTTNHQVVAPGQPCFADVHVDVVTPPMQFAVSTGHIVSPGNLNDVRNWCFMVPPGYYYTFIDQSAGGNAIFFTAVWEIEL